MSKTTRILTASLLDAVALFIGVYGIIFSIITAYDIRLRSNTVLWVLILSSMCFSLTFNIEKFKKTAYITVSSVCAVFLLLYAESIVNGFLKFIYLITSKLSLFSPSVPVTRDVPLPILEAINANTSFFSFFAVVVVLLLALSIIKARSVWLASVISICTFFISLIFIKSVPDTLPVWAFLVFLLSTILTCFIRKSSSRRASYMLSLFLPVTLAFVIAVTAIFPQATYNRTNLADVMYKYFAERLPLTLKDPSGDPGSTYTEGSGVDVSTVSGTGSGSYTEEKKAYDQIDLNNSLPNRTESAVIKVNSSKEGSLLLRGFSLGNYTGSSWAQFDKIVQKKLNASLVVDPFTEKLEKETYVTPISLASYFALTTDKAQKYSVSVNEIAEGGEIAYTPYFSYFDNLQSMVYGSDAYTLYKNNSVYHRNEKAAYITSAFSHEDITSVLKNASGSARNTEAFKDIVEFESVYRNAVYKYYTEIDGKTFTFLEEYTRKQNFWQITDRKALVDAVSDFVKKSAEYDAETPQTPKDKDYLQYFLTESKQGYCMHFATEATLIFRMLGVPARYVTGYSLKIDSDSVGKWVNATGKNSHAWTEVYFDGIGWIPVDVTPGIYQNQAGTTSQNTPNSTSTPSTSINTSRPPVSRSEGTSSSEESELSSDSSNVELPPKKDNSIPLWIYPVVLFIGALVFIYFRRKHLLDKRKKLFNQQDTNKAVIFAWNYIEKLRVYGVNPDKSIYSTAQKAVFSKHKLTEEERKTVVGFAEDKAKELDSSLGFFKKLIFKFMKGLY